MSNPVFTLVCNGLQKGQLVPYGDRSSFMLARLPSTFVYEYPDDLAVSLAVDRFENRWYKLGSCFYRVSSTTNYPFYEWVVIDALVACKTSEMIRLDIP